MIHKLISDISSKLTGRRRLAACIAAVIAIGALGWTQFRATKSVIQVDGKSVACLPSENDARQVLQDIKCASGCDPEEVEFRQKVVVARAPREAQPVSRHRALHLVRTAVSPVVMRWCVIVDGVPVVAVPDQKVGGEVLDLAKLKFGCLVKNLAEEPQFKQNVKVDVAAICPSMYRRTADAALDLIFAEPEVRTEEGVYEVRKGDVAGAIAVRHGIKLSEIQALNPGINIERLQIGDRLRIKALKHGPPKLVVVVRDMNTRVESVRPPVRKVSSAQMYAGKTALVSPGSWGKRNVRAVDIYENGRKVGYEIIEEETIESPSARIIAVGIKPRPTWN